MDKPLNGETIKNSLWEFLSKIIEKAGSIAFTIILARFLMPEGFGVYNLVMAIALIFISAIDYSIDTTSIRYVSNALAKKNKSLANNYFKYIFKMKLTMAGLTSFLLLVLSYPLSFFIFKKPELFAPLIISSFYIFILSISSNYESLFYTIKKVKGKLIKNFIQQIFKITLSLLVFLLLVKIYYIVGIILSLSLTSFAVFLFIFYYLKREAPFLYLKPTGIPKDKIKIKRFSYYLLMISILGLLFMYVDILILGAFIEDTKYIGFYSAAATLIWGISGFLSFAVVLLPLLTQTKQNQINEIFNKILKYSFMISIPASFGIFVLSRYIIFFIYGKEYLEASIILSILSFLIIEIINSGLVSTLITAKEKPEYTAKVYFIALVLNIILCIILIMILLKISPLYATIGAAISTLIVRYFVFISMIKVMKNKLNIKIQNSVWIKPFVSSIVMVIFISTANHFLIKDMNIIAGCIEMVFGVLIYFLVLYVLKGITSEDIRYIKNRIFS